MALIALFTYVVIGIFLYTINVPVPWLSAIVPAVGFSLSTFSMPYFKRRWIRRRSG